MGVGEGGWQKQKVKGGISNNNGRQEEKWWQRRRAVRKARGKIAGEAGRPSAK